MSRYLRRLAVALGIGAALGLWIEHHTRPYRRPSACPKHGRHPHPFPRGGLPT